MAVSATLIATAALMGLAGTPHCVAMCGAACTAIGPSRGGSLALHAGRLVSYAAAGALAAASVDLLARLGQAVALLKPLWLLVHLAAFALGLFLLWQGRQPAWLAGLGSTRAAAAAPQAVVLHGMGVAGAAPNASRGLLRPAAAGLGWSLWPCGLLQSALLVAALAPSAGEGAAAMAAFSLASSLGLLGLPWVWRRLHRARDGAQGGSAAPTLAVRLAGAMLAAASLWAIGHDVFTRFLAWCMT